MDIGVWREEERVQEVGDEDEEDEGGVDIPSFQDQLKLGVELLQKRGGICRHGKCCQDTIFRLSSKGALNSYVAVGAVQMGVVELSLMVWLVLS